MKIGSNENNTIVSATDNIKAYGEQLSSYTFGTFKSLGTDGFGRSDSRENLREHFEINANFIVFSTTNVHDVIMWCVSKDSRLGYLFIII